MAALAGIEIEDDPVRAFDLVDRRAPGMDLEHAGLDESDDALDVADEQNLLLAILVCAPSRGAMKSDKPGPGMLLEEAALLGARGAAHQGERAVDDVRQEPVRDLDVELGEALLGDALFLPEHPVGMGEA